jgi:hypothetical protein
MSEYQVTCITKPNRFSTHEHITHIGNVSSGWRLTRETAIYRIEFGVAKFFTIEASTGKKAYLDVVKPDFGGKYLRTHADGKWNDNLLAQRECGETCSIIA